LGLFIGEKVTEAAEKLASISAIEGLFSEPVDELFLPSSFTVLAEAL
jgi:hypothetical protein